MAATVFGYSYFQTPRSSLSKILLCASYFNLSSDCLSSLRYPLYDFNVATVRGLYQILSTLRICHDFRNSHCKRICELVIVHDKRRLQQ